jgi:hypothetical protein
MTRRRSPTPEDFQEQLDALEELETIESRLRWVPQGAIERFLLGVRRGQLNAQVSAWNRRFLDVEGEDTEGHSHGWDRTA